MTAVDHGDSPSPQKLDRKAYAGLLLVSAIYFGDISLKASRKCFWFDELVTTYLCRLPNFKATWVAVLHGADFNPPLLYLFTHWSQSLTGEGLIATRLPSMVGVWLFCVCLFLFVSRRAGTLAGFVAGTFPFFTLVQFYAYEARAHGIVLGWCGLTLVCWQRTSEGRAKYLWLTGFALSLMGALLTHLYAVYIIVPFVLVEVVNLVRRYRLDWGIIAAAALTLVSVTVTVYLPLFREYRANVPSGFFSASHDVFQRFLVVVIGPAIDVLIILLVLLALEQFGRNQGGSALAAASKRDMLLAVGFACIPLLGLLGSKVSHGPFIERYFLSSVAGYAMLLGFAISRRRSASWTTRALAVCMLLLMIGDLASTVYLGIVNRVVLLEPSAPIVLGTNPANPMERYEMVSSDRSGLDILVLRPLYYLYFVRYAPAAVVSRLYFGAPENDMFLKIYQRLAEGAQINLQTTTFSPFLAKHDKFEVYGGADNGDVRAIQAFEAAGYTLKSAQADANGVMYSYEK